MQTNQEIITFKEKGVLTIKINRQHNKNSLHLSNFREIINILNAADKDDDIKVVYFTSTGNIFNAGVDFNSFLDNKEKDKKLVEKFFNCVIDFPKVIIGGVNGKAIGIGVTMLFLFDIVLCSKRSTFSTPFLKIGLTPEGCSTYLFPMILGKSMANHLILNSGEMTADKAESLGAVLHAYENNEFEEKAYQYAVELANMPLKRLLLFKNMITRINKKKLKEINEYEMDVIEKYGTNSDEFKQILMKYGKKPKF